MTAASEDVPAEEGLGSADLLAALRAVARRLRQAGGTLHLSDHTFDLRCPLRSNRSARRLPRFSRAVPAVWVSSSSGTHRSRRSGRTVAS